MLKPSKPLSVFFFCLFLIVLIIVPVKAQEETFEREILPSQGNANTIITLRFRTLNETVGPVDSADIFWDNSTIALFQQGIPGADGSYNYNVSVPNEPPLSDVGNHIIQVRANVSNYGSVAFDFTFTITEFVPSLEYLALNATYYSLLGNYTDLLVNYDDLLGNYTALIIYNETFTVMFSELLQNYNQLSSNYNSLTASYNALNTNYNTLTANYNALNTLTGNYTLLRANFESLNSTYDALRQDYDSLNSNYDRLKTIYGDVSGELTFSRNLIYIFMASTVVLAATTLYFARRKQKTDSSARSLKTRY